LTASPSFSGAFNPTNLAIGELRNAYAAVFDKTVTIKPLGDMTVLRALAQVCASHGMTHAGEIELLRTLVGSRPVRDV
jgi:hypothetical protein